MKAHTKRRICVVTGTRAEYGIYRPLLDRLRTHSRFKLQLVVTGSHLSPEFGLTYRGIESDGFRIDEKIEMLLSSDTPVATTKSLALGTLGFADAFSRLAPHLLIVLGDRYEMLAAGQAALLAKIPVAHIAGGDTTEGAYDESIRHCLTKLSHVHFVTNPGAARRVKQLGEDPQRVFDVGHPSIDTIRNLKVVKRTALEKELGFKFRKRNILVTFHAATLDPVSPEEQCQEVLTALSELGPEYGIVMTKSNADTGGLAINRMVEAFEKSHPNVRCHTSLGQRLYFSVAREVDAVVGNSSSGICEIPSLGKPTVNIGDRQKGRFQARSTLNCPARAPEILATIRRAVKMDCSRIDSPYGHGGSAEKMVRALEQIPDFSVLTTKHFFDLGS